MVLGNWVFSAVDLANAAVSALASLMLLASVLFAACTSATPLSVEIRLLSAFQRASDAAEALKPASCNDSPGATATGEVLAPAPCSTLPAVDRKTGNEEALSFCAVT